MPFKSEKQRRYLYANEPEVAKKFQKEESMEAPSTPHENMTNLSKKMSYSKTKKKKKYPGSAQDMQYKEKDGMKYGTGTGRKTSNRGVLY